MNRLHQPPAPHRSGDDHKGSRSIGANLTTPPAIEFPHRLFVPEHYEASYAYPLLVWLHSDHSSEYELDGLMQSLSLRNYAAVAIRGNRTSRRSQRLYRWGSTPTEYALNEECVFQAIEQVSASMSIHPSKVFLGGFGHGATLAQWIGLRNPHHFAGLVACNGPFPKSRRALSEWKNAQQLPVLAMQSHDSNRFGVDQAIEMMKLAHRANLQYQFLRFQPSINDPESWAFGNRDNANDEGSLQVEMLQVANRFMMGIVTGNEIPLQNSSESHSVSVR